LYNEALGSYILSLAATGRKSMLKGFREFVLRGNVVDMAVGVVIGAAFGAIVTAFVKDLLTPLIAALAGKPDFSAYVFEVNGSKFFYGDFINAIVSFLLIAGAVYFFVVVPVNALMARIQRGETPAPNKKKCPECLSDIPVEAHKCAFCTSSVA
jgi:large conductance mechanosensitive channel